MCVKGERGAHSADSTCVCVLGGGGNHSADSTCVCVCVCGGLIQQTLLVCMCDGGFLFVGAHMRIEQRCFSQSYFSAKKPSVHH